MRVRDASLARKIFTVNISTTRFCYAQSAQLRRIRKKMVQIMQSEVAKGPLRDTVKFLTVDKLCDEMKKQTNRIFPLDPVHIVKAKVIKKPKLDIVKLMENHDKGTGF